MSFKVNLRDGSEFLKKLYHALMGDSITTLLIVAVTFIEFFVPKLTTVFLGLIIFFALRSVFWKYFDSHDERKIQKDLGIIVSNNQVELKKLQNQQDKISFSRDKFNFKKEVVQSQEKMRGQIIQTRLKNIEKRNEFNITLGSKVIEELGLSKEAIAEVNAKFDLTDKEVEFLATDGISIPYENLHVDKKLSMPMPTSFQMTDEKFKQIDIGEDESE